MALKRVSDTTPIIIKQTIEGKRGKPGKDGVTTIQHEIVTKHEPGVAPEHEIRNGEVRFKNPDGTWGKWIVMPVAPGGCGGTEAVKYTNITKAKYKINRNELIVGTNIFGVDYPDEAEIILPSGIDKNIIMVIKDESNNASSNNIVITTENP